MVQENGSDQPESYGLGNPNVQYTGTPWDVYLAPLSIVVIATGMLIWHFGLSLAEFRTWSASLFS